jgi:LytS/YehU family sensor histidine kinase
MVQTFLTVDEASVIILGRILTGLVITTVLHLAYQSLWMERAKRWIKWSSIFLLNIAFCLGGAALWLEMIRRGAPELPAESPFLSMALSRFYSLLLWNTAYFGISFILNYHSLKLEAAEAKLATRSSELQHLQSQLNPHFLFNALTLVQHKIDAGSPGQEVVQMLSDYLRYSLATSRPLEPLGRELDALESYLELQRARFVGNLDCFIEASPAALQVLVPPMLVQPLLENAFKFGPRTSAMPMHIEVTAVVENNRLQVAVANSGCWVPPSSGDSVGSGLANLRRRLFLLLGEAATLEVLEKPQAVVVMIRIPILSQAQADLLDSA